MRPLLAGIDLGTSGLKVVLLNQSGDVLSIATSNYPILSDTAGRAEQDPRVWWQALRAAFKHALSSCGGDSSSLIGIGLSGQMHGIVPLDETDRPLRPAILWADQRGSEEVNRIENIVDRSTLLAHTGNRASVSYTAPKILWLRHNEPELFARCRHILLPKDYLRLLLTGEFATEPTDASATLLFDLEKRDWSGFLLDRFEIPRELLPPVVQTLDIVGKLRREAASELGLPVGIPVAAGAGDTPAQAVGYGVLNPGDALLTLSSGGQLFLVRDQPQIDPQGRVHTLCYITEDRWYLMGALLAAGLALRWLRDQFGRDLADQSYETFLMEAERVPVGSDGLLFLPYLLGERTPHMDNNARAVFFGLSLQHDRASATRAVLEGVAFAFRDALLVFQEIGIGINELRIGAGGSQSPLWRGILADVLGLPLTRTDAEQGAALGAALLAGIGVGYFKDLVETSTAMVHSVETIIPRPERTAYYDEMFELYRKLYQRTKDLFGELKEIREKTPPGR
jgi:xylulokinase